MTPDLHTSSNITQPKRPQKTDRQYLVRPGQRLIMEPRFSLPNGYFDPFCPIALTEGTGPWLADHPLLKTTVSLYAGAHKSGNIFVVEVMPKSRRYHFFCQTTSRPSRCYQGLGRHQPGRGLCKLLTYTIHAPIRGDSISRKTESNQCLMQFQCQKHKASQQN